MRIHRNSKSSNLAQGIKDKQVRGQACVHRPVHLPASLGLYLSAYNAYCQVYVEGAYINMKLIIGNRESGTGN